MERYKGSESGKIFSTLIADTPLRTTQITARDKNVQTIRSRLDNKVMKIDTTGKDDGFDRVQSTNTQVMGTLASLKTFDSQVLGLEKVSKVLTSCRQRQAPKIDRAEIARKMQGRLEQKLRHVYEQGTPEHVQNFQRHLEQTQPWMEHLSKKERLLLSTGLQYKLDADPEIKALFEDKERHMLDALNQSRQDQQFLNMRILKLYIGMTTQINDEHRRKEILAECEQLGISNVETRQDSHLQHPEAQRPPPLHSLKPAHSFHLPSEKQNDRIEVLGDALAGGSEHDIRPFLRSLDASTFLMVVVAVTPALFRQVLLTEATPHAHHFLLEVLESANSEELFEALFQALDSVRVQSSEELMRALQANFEQATAGERKELLSLTSCAELKAAWLKMLTPHKVAQLIMQGSVTEQCLVLDLLKDKDTQDEVAQMLSLQDQEAIETERVLAFADQEKLTLDKIDEQEQARTTFIKRTARKFLQYVPRKGQFVCLTVETRCTEADKLKQEQDRTTLGATFKVTTKPLFNKNDLFERIGELDDLDERGQKAMRNRLKGKGKDQPTEMHLELQQPKGVDYKEPPQTYFVSLWGFCEDSLTMQEVEKFPIGEPVRFKDSSSIANVSQQHISLFQGRDTKDVFWFSWKEAEVGGLRTLQLSILAPNEKSPQLFDVPEDSKLFKNVTQGIDYVDSGHSMMNLAPTLIRAPESDAALIVYSHFEWANGYPEVRFFDVEQQRDLCVFNRAQGFLMRYSEDDQSHLVFQVDPILASEPPVQDAASLAALDKLFGEKTKTVYKNGYPRWYSLKVNFEELRGQDETVEIGNEATEDLQFLEEVANKNKKQIIKICADLSGWIYVKDVDYSLCSTENNMNAVTMTYLTQGPRFCLIQHRHSQHGTYSYVYVGNIRKSNVTQQKRTNNMLTLAIEDFNQSSKGNGEASLMRVAKASGRTELAKTNKPNEITSAYDWSLPQEKVRGKLFQYAAAVCREHLVRPCLDAQGQIAWSVGSRPDKPSDTKLKMMEQVNGFRDGQQVVNYPLMCQVLDKHELTVHHLADPDQSDQRFFFPQDEIVSLVEGSDVWSETRINLITYDPRKEELSLVIMRHDSSMAKTQAHDLNKWSIQKFSLGASYDRIRQEQASIVTIFMLESADLKLRTSSGEVTQGFLIQTKTGVILVDQSQSYEVFDSSENEYCPVKLVHGHNRIFYYVRREMSSQTSQIVELSMTLTNGTFAAKKHTIFHCQAGMIRSVSVDPSLETKHTATYSKGGKKHTIRSNLRACLFVIDDMLNLTKLKQTGSEQNYEILSRKNLSSVPGLQNIIKQLEPFEKLSITDRCLVAGGTLVDLDTLQSYPLFAGKDLTEWRPFDLNSNFTNGKLVFSLKHKSTQQVCYAVRDHMGTRNQTMMGARLDREVLQSCFLADNLVLFQVRTDRADCPYWTLMSVDGRVQSIQASLCRILSQDQWSKVSVSLTSDGQRQLLLASEKSCVHAKLTWEGQLVSSQTFSLLDSQKRVVDSVLADFDGNLYRASVMNHNEEECMDVLVTRTNNPDGAVITNLTFQSGRANQKFVMCGEYICWINYPTKQLKALSVNTLNGLGVRAEISLVDPKRNLKTIDLGPHLEDKINMETVIEPCGLLFAMHAGPSQEFSAKSLRSCLNKVQLTVANSAVVFDLHQKQPPVVGQTSAMDQLIDPESYVEGGLKLGKVTVQPFQGRKYGIHTSIESNWSASHYMRRRFMNIPPAVKITKQSNLHEQSTFGGLFKSHSYLDVLVLLEALQVEQHGAKHKQISWKSTFATFSGCSFFDITESFIQLHHTLRETLVAQDFQEEEDNDGEPVENPNLRKLSQALQLKSSCEVDVETGKVLLKSVLARNYHDTGKRDSLLSLGRLSTSYSLLDELADQDDFAVLLENISPQITLELNRCLKETKGTQKIKVVQWPREVESLTIRSNSVMPDKAAIEAELCDEPDRVLKTVKVRQLNMQWLLRRNNNFVGLAEKLTDVPDSVYESDFVEHVLEEFWDENQTMIIRRQFIPYLFYLVSAMWYLKLALEDHETEVGQSWVVTLGILFMLQWGYQVYHELVQFIEEENKWGHFTSFWNVNDFLGLCLMLIIVFDTIFGDTSDGFLDVEHLRVVAAVASCCTMIKLFDWLRLFDGTAFYISLLAQTVADIQAFMILLLAALMAFGMPMFMLNMNRGEDNAVLDEPFSVWVLNIMMNQYLLALGEFNFDNFADNPQYRLCYFFFIMATFITQLTMLNMLIAIMGDTFGRVMENKDVNATKIKLKILSDCDHTIPKRSSDHDRDIFLYVVSPVEEELDEDSEWMSAVTLLTKTNDERLANLKTSLVRQIEKIQERQDDQVKRQAASERQLRDLIKQSTDSILGQIMASKEDDAEKHSEEESDIE